MYYSIDQILEALTMAEPSGPILLGGSKYISMSIIYMDIHQILLIVMSPKYAQEECNKIQFSSKTSQKNLFIGRIKLCLFI